MIRARYLGRVVQKCESSIAVWGITLKAPHKDNFGERQYGVCPQDVVSSLDDSTVKKEQADKTIGYHPTPGKPKMTLFYVFGIKNLVPIKVPTSTVKDKSKCTRTSHGQAHRGDLFNRNKCTSNHGCDVATKKSQCRNEWI